MSTITTDNSMAKSVIDLIEAYGRMGVVGRQSHGKIEYFFSKDIVRYVRYFTYGKSHRIVFEGCTYEVIDTKNYFASVTVEFNEKKQLKRIIAIDELSGEELSLESERVKELLNWAKVSIS